MYEAMGEVVKLDELGFVAVPLQRFRISDRFIAQGIDGEHDD